ncbi:hypothetical protein [Burkholderia cepacia]|uniref:Uncharacterized protein n=1 Tax=Burkholderia cepacia TaxID=292 RepID=A0ABM6NVF5_BURCE|nr:hypothetical protein [Burkholderia cepacia]AIO25657.1 putative signal peptide protein [Burkholderia cepacia ATCC 25416]ASE93485.1 hypothetical protein CEQ23_07450 [Burkholderia cepacia]ATF78344.1 hypothetical protein CO711_13540 [Burkholderia cepacia]MCA8466294.1 hypothetical protein [Burkholderia cepacia]MDN7764184.1 hypothetical protein [Burkholderia cepacia]
MVTVKSLAAGGALWCALLSTAGAHDTHVVPKAADSRAAHMSMQAAPAQQKQPLATGAAFDTHHRLWGAWVEGAHVVVAHSDAAGRTLSAPVTVNAMPEPIYTSAENRPKIATSPDMQLAMVAMDVYDDNGVAISRALAQMHLPQVVQYANAEPMPERLSAALDAGWRGEMPRTVWIGRDGAREARSGLLTADVLDGGLQRARR